MADFDPVVLEACALAKEVDFTTWGRVTGRPARVIIWITGRDGRLFIRSGQGLTRDWPRNLLARGRGMLHVGGMDVLVQASLLDPVEARAVNALVEAKYAVTRPGAPDGSPTPAERATFELRPDTAPPA